jgi:hypothetical protein
MLVMDIVNRAVMKSGVVSSFNPDEVPEDIQQRAADVLRNEIIRELNCDRNVDITETVLPFRVTHGRVDLVTTPLDYERVIYGSVPQTAATLLKTELTYHGPEGARYPVYILKNLGLLLDDMGIAKYEGFDDTVRPTDKWPTDQFGGYRDIAIWTSDYKLIKVDKPDENGYVSCLWHNYTDWDATVLIDKRYNVPFYPAYIDEVYRAGDGAYMQYLHHGEMVSAEFRHSQLVYTVEDNITKMTIRFNPTCNPGTVLVVLPVPIKVINSFEEPHPWMGTIVAPEKFYSLLLNILAWRMAVEYGVDTKADMQRQAETSYANILRNKVRREHAQDIPREIFKYLRGRDTLTPVETNGYSGGYYG